MLKKFAAVYRAGAVALKTVLYKRKIFVYFAFTQVANVIPIKALYSVTSEHSRTGSGDT